MITQGTPLPIQSDLQSIHRLVIDLRRHRAAIYWTDFLTSTLIFWICVSFFVLQSWNWTLQIFLLIAGTLALYRSALFLHEISHLPPNALPGFEFTWNLIIGWPLLFPSLFIKSHLDHHRASKYGTVMDPEYLPFALAPSLIRVWFVMNSGITPALLLIRALLIVPFSWIRPSLRHWLRSRASRMTMNSRYVPPLESQRLDSWHEGSELVTTLSAWIWISAVCLNSEIYRIALVVFSYAVLVNLINGCRTLYSHNYTSNGNTMNALWQLQDTNNFNLFALLGELVAPVGQRFHATHHLLPYLPYHALAEADRRIKGCNWTGRKMYLDTFR